jgi:hypothetical protein
MRKLFIYSILTVLLLASCKTTEKKLGMKTDNINYSIEQAIVYKTIGNFNNLVPVTMNSAKTKITSYPAPLDLMYNGRLAKPTLLKNGYLLDNRGISVNTVFLKFTYEEYSKMTEAPSLETMMNNIAEKYPFSEIYHCGARSQYSDNGVKKLNTLIDTGFAGCKKEAITPLQTEF